MRRLSSVMALVVAFLLVLALAPDVQAQRLPCRAVKLIVPWKAGGGTDVIFRVVARSAQKYLGQDIVIVNISGQGGNKGAKEAKRARPNGCTIFAGHDSMQTSYVQGRVNFNYFAFEPIVLITHTPSIMGAHPDVPWKNAKEVVEYAKKHPNTILFGATLGSTSHFFPVMVEAKMGIKFKFVGYEGTRNRMTALLGKHIQLGEINITAAKKYIKQGKLKALGIATPERDPRLPNIPTLREQGIDVVTGINRGVFAPKGTPEPVLKRLEAAFAKAAKDPAVVKDLTAKGTTMQFKPRKEYIAFLKKNAKEIETLAKAVGLYKAKGKM